MMKRLRAAFVATAIGALTLSVVACKKPGAGDPCREIGRTTCIDAAHALACRGFSWHADRCLGPRACSEHDGTTECDQTVAEENDTCGEHAQLVCTPDKKAMLRCDGAKFHEVATCRGANGCDAGHGRTTCDVRSAREGDPCVTSDEPAHACTETNDVELACIDGVFMRWSECHGEKGCRASFHDVTCDQSVAAEGAPCHSWIDTCSLDRKSMLHCSDSRNGHWTAKAACGGPHGCAPRPNTEHVDCDQTIANVGAPCNLTSGLKACTPDHKSMLACGVAEDAAGTRDRHRHDTCAIGPRSMVVESKCPHKCEVTESYYECI
jgi:hypothetical protein